jgi:hypothetical protein
MQKTAKYFIDNAKPVNTTLNRFSVAPMLDWTKNNTQLV